MGNRSCPKRFGASVGGLQVSMRSETPINDEEIRMGVAKNKAQEVKGKTKEVTGKATHDRSLEAKGKGEKAKGNLKQAGRNVKGAVGKK